MFFGIDDISRYRQYFIDTTRYFIELEKPDKTEVDIKTLQKIVFYAENDINSSKKPAGYLLNIVNLTKQYIDKSINFEKYKTAYLTDDDTKRVNVSKKDYLVEEQERVHKLNQKMLDQRIFDDTIALFDLSVAFTNTYKGIKAERNALDFDDLILFTKKLFSKPDVMGWILSQLDLSLGHILVDEAQDTSPEQWEILKLLSCDFFTDGDTENKPHSLFVVGDTKQSIYGFQGADPLAFANSKDEIASQIRQNLRTIREVPLVQSFRSTAPILRVVDNFFGNQKIRDISGFINNEHKCFRQNETGLVELHKLFSKDQN
jgi:ATP-dependent helicase/nuclease subunit A